MNHTIHNSIVNFIRGIADYEPDTGLRDSEQVLLLEDGGEAD